MNLDPEKLLMLLAIAVVVLGPERLPQAARNFAKAMAEFRRISSGFQSQLREVMAEPRDAVNDVKSATRFDSVLASSASRSSSTSTDLNEGTRSGGGPTHSGGSAVTSGVAPGGSSLQSPVPLPDDPAWN